MSNEDYYMNALFLGYILGKNSNKDELVCIPEYLTKLGWIHKTELEKDEQLNKAKIAQLEQENIKLKKAVAENVKLWELMCIMHGEMVSCEDNGYVCGGHKFDERIRELGAEMGNE